MEPEDTQLSILLLDRLINKQAGAEKILEIYMFVGYI